MFVATNMTGIKRAKLFTPFPSDYVRSVLKKVGVVKRCFGYWPHELQVGRRLRGGGYHQGDHTVSGWVSGSFSQRHHSNICRLSLLRPTAVRVGSRRPDEFFTYLFVL